MPASSREVFEVLHDYDHRAEWDPVLCEAELLDGHRAAGPGAVCRRRSKPHFGGIELESEYVMFHPGALAAVRMTNHPWCLDSFGSCVRHEDTAEGSVATYSANFHSRPRWLRWLMEPVMEAVFRHETKKRLEALARQVGGREPVAGEPRVPSEAKHA